MVALLKEKLAQLQAFDTALKSGNQFDRLSTQYAQSVLFERDEDKRLATIEELSGKFVDYFKRRVQPDARKLGQDQAQAIVGKLRAEGVKPDLSNPDFRRRILIDDKLRPSDRVKIFSSLVNADGSTLNGRLTSFWLEPGVSVREKTQRLKQLHLDLEKQRKHYEQQVIAFNDGERKDRPKAPNLDYMGKFTRMVKTNATDQARRAGTEAETAVFVSQGHPLLTWIAVGGATACVDCRARQGVTGDIQFWEQMGRPGAGKTRCRQSCYCLLVPAETVQIAPSLTKGLDTSVPEANPKTSAMTDADVERLRKAKE